MKRHWFVICLKKLWLYLSLGRGLFLFKRSLTGMLIHTFTLDPMNISKVFYRSSPQECKNGFLFFIPPKLAGIWESFFHSSHFADAIDMVWLQPLFLMLCRRINCLLPSVLSRFVFFPFSLILVANIMVTQILFFLSSKHPLLKMNFPHQLRWIKINSITSKTLQIDKGFHLSLPQR